MIDRSGIPITITHVQKEERRQKQTKQQVTTVEEKAGILNFFASVFTGSQAYHVSSL